MGERRDDFIIACAPIGIASKPREIAEIAAGMNRFHQYFSERCGVAQTQIESLPGHRVHGVCGVADNYQTRAHVLTHLRQRERMDLALADAQKTSEAFAETILQLGPECFVIPGFYRIDLIRRDRPNHRAIIGSGRQQSQRAGLGEPLVGGTIVRVFGCHRAHDCGLTIVDAARFNSGGFANRRVCTVRRDDQARAQIMLGTAGADAHACRVIADLIEMGHAYRPQLGFDGIELSPSLARLFGLPLERGYLVEEVLPRSPAALAGLQSGDRIVVTGDRVYAFGGDIITAVNGQAIAGASDIARLLLEARPGELLRLEVHRAGARHEVVIPLERMRMF